MNISIYRTIRYPRLAIIGLIGSWHVFHNGICEVIPCVCVWRLPWRLFSKRVNTCKPPYGGIISAEAVVIGVVVMCFNKLLAVIQIRLSVFTPTLSHRNTGCVVYSFGEMLVSCISQHVACKWVFRVDI